MYSFKPEKILKMNLKKIVVIGSANTDMVVKTEVLPSPGETKLGGVFFMNAGGKGANQAVAAARMGGSVMLVTKVGNDIFGKQTIAGLLEEKINTSFVFTDKAAPSGVALIMVNDKGENCIAVAPGANARLRPADIERVTYITDAEIILIQLEIPMETVELVARMAKQNGQQLIINPAPAQKLEDEVLKDLFLITPNETEASLLTGIKVTDEASASQAADFFLDKGVQNVIVTMGSAGAYFQNSRLKIKVDAPMVQAVDTTAAGDTFSGALAVAISEMYDWDEAIGFAVEAASLSVTRLGAQASIPYRNELKNFMTSA
jgi:ribokinase